MQRLAVFLFAVIFSTIALQAEDLRVGLIGLDTSHVTAFTKLLNDSTHKDHVPGAKVVAGFKGGSVDIPSSRDRVEEYTKQLRDDYKVKIVDSIEELCTLVDVVMLESVDGRPHLAQARPVIAAGKPLFIDKPLAGSLRDALEIVRLAKEKKVPLFSSSSLRYYPGLVELRKADVGQLKGALSTGPAPTEPHHPDLFWYGIHPTEALFTIMGRGCDSVVRTTTDNTDVITGIWSGGRVGTVWGIREAKAPYRVTVFGTKAVLDQKPGGDYAPLVREVVKFFQTGVSPVAPEETIELFAFMEAADESKRRGGQPVKLREVLEKQRRRLPHRNVRTPGRKAQVRQGIQQKSFCRTSFCHACRDLPGQERMFSQGIRSVHGWGNAERWQAPAQRGFGHLISGDSAD